MALEQGSGSRLDDADRRRREQQDNWEIEAREHEARVQAAITAYQQSQTSRYDPTAGAKYPPKEEEKPVYRVERGRDAAERRAREERERGMAQYHASERNNDTARPLLSYLPSRDVSVSSEDRPDTGAPSIAPSRPWEDTTSLEPERERDEPVIERSGNRSWGGSGWAGSQLPVAAVSTNIMTAAPIVGGLLASSAQGIGNWLGQWRSQQQADREAAPQNAIGSTFGPRASVEEKRDEIIEDTHYGQYYGERSQQRRDDWSEDGNLSLGDRVGDAALGFADWAFDAPFRHVFTTPVNDLIPGEVEGEKDKAPLAKWPSVIGSVLNRSLNPFNPNLVPAEERGIAEGQSAWSWDAIKADAAWYVNEVREGAAEWDAAMTYLNTLPEAQQETARRGLMAAPSGGERTIRAMQALVEQPAKITGLEQALEQARAAGDSQKASQINMQLAVEENRPWTELVDEQMNPWAEVVFGVLLDPLDWIGGGAGALMGGGTILQSIKNAKYAKMYNITPQQGVSQLAEQFRRTPELLRTVGGESPDAAANQLWKFWQRTPESAAAQDLDALIKTVTGAFVPITDAEDAKRVLNSLTTDGGQSLINGLSGLNSEAIRGAVGGTYRWGAGAIGNADSARVAPYWAAAADQIANMGVWGDEVFDSTRFIAELTEVLGDVTRQAHGLRTPGALPFGAASVRVRKIDPTNGVLEYLNDAGDVFRTGSKMAIGDATAAADKLVETGKRANPVELAAQVQKAVMSDMFLALRPANWIRNGLSAATMLVSEDAFTWLPNKAIKSDFMRRFGGVLPWADANAVEQTGSGALSKIGEFVFRNKDNPLSNFMKRAYDIPYGEGVGGEGWFRNKARYTMFNRALESAWKGVVNNEVAPVLKGLNLSADVESQIVGLFETLGISGSRAETASRIRQVMNRAYIPVDARKALGISVDDLTADTIDKVQGLLNSYRPEQAAEAAAELRKVLDAARSPYASVLSQISPQPVVRYTSDMIAQEVAMVRDVLADLGKRAGVPNAKSEAGKVARGVIQGTQESIQQMLNDIAHIPGDTRIVNALNDYFGILEELRVATRREVDALGRAAVNTTADPNALWGAKWKGTREAYERLTTDTQAATKTFRSLLAGLITDPNQVYTSQHDWAKTLKRYVDFDEDVYRQALKDGLVLGGTRDDPDKYASVIESYRGRVDQSFVVLLEALKKYPSVDNFDLFANALQMADSFGRRQAARLVESAREAMDGRISWTEYFERRNVGWQTQWLNATITNNDATLRQIIENGMTGQGKLPSHQELVEAAAKAKMDARQARLASNPAAAAAEAIRTSEAAAKAAKANEAAAARLAKLTEAEELKAAAKKSKEMEATKAAAIKATKNAMAQEVERAIGSSRTLATAEQGFEAAREARNAMREMWNSVAKGDWAKASIDSAIMRFKRGGVVNMNMEKGDAELLYEDLLGLTIGGRRIDSLNDIWQYFEDYGALKNKMDMHERVIRQYKEFAKMTPAEIVDATRNEFIRAEFTPADIEKLRGHSYTEVMEMLEIVRGMARGEEFDPPTAMSALPDAVSIPEINDLFMPRLTDEAADLIGLTIKASDEAETAAEAADPVAAAVGAAAKAADPVAAAAGAAAKAADPAAAAAGAAAKAADPAAAAVGAAAKAAPPTVSPSDIDTVINDLKAALGKKGGMPTATVGDMADAMLKNIDGIEQKLIAQLPQLLSGVPNSLTPSQRLDIIDMADRLMPRYDDTLSQALRVADDMAGWLMLNFADKRNFDTILGMLMPFPYFWSRMLPRAALAAVTKPTVVKNYYHVKQNIRRENIQSDIPATRYGTVPNPTGIGPNRLDLSSLVDSMIPGVMYMNPNPFVEPDAANNDTARWLLNLQRWTPGMLPVTQYAANAMLDRVSPRNDGLSWNNGFQLSDLIPAWKIGYYAMMARQGNIPQDAGGIMSGGDEFDYGRIGKGIELEGQANTGDERLWARDVVQQAKDDLEALPEQWSGAEGLAAEGAKRAGSDRLQALLASYLIGMSGYNWTEEEQRAIAAREERRAMGYDLVTNPDGSKAAVDAFDAETNEIGRTFGTYGSLYPQAVANPELGAAAESRPVPSTYPYRQPRSDERAGLSAARSERADELRAVYDDYGARIDAVKYPFPENGTKDEIAAWYEARPKWEALQAERDAKVEEIKAQYPSVVDTIQQPAVRPDGAPLIDPTAGIQPPGNLDFYGSMNPQELAEQAAKNAESMAYAKYEDIKVGPEDRPVRPAKGASQAEWDAYKKANEEYKERQSAYYDSVNAEIDRLMQDPSRLVFGRPTGLPSSSRSAAGAANVTGEAAKKIRETEGKAAGDFGRNGNAETKDHWAAFEALGEDWDRKAEYMRNNPAFARAYKKLYGKESAWWEKYTPKAGRIGTAYSYSGGGGGGGYGGGGGEEDREMRMDVYIPPAEYDRGLMPRGQGLQAWRPMDVQMQWLNAGANLRPDRLQRWRLRTG